MYICAGGVAADDIWLDEVIPLGLKPVKKGSSRKERKDKFKQGFDGRKRKIWKERQVNPGMSKIQI